MEFNSLSVSNKLKTSNQMYDSFNHFRSWMYWNYKRL